MRTLRWHAAAAVIGVVLAAGPARAQETATTLDQLRVLVAPGQQVSVTDRDGQRVTGRVLSLSSSGLAVEFRGAQRTFTDNDITAISQRQADSLANGAKIGFGIGAAIGFLGGLAFASDVENGAALIPFFAGIYGGLGAGIGVGFDAMIEGNRVIYARPASGGRMSFAPIAGRGKRGVSIGISF